VGATLEAALSWIDGLPAAQRSSSAWQRERSIALLRIGDMWVTHGQLEAALAAYEEGLTVARRLAAADPQNAGWQRDLSFSL
jgi:hypothetical protein